MGWRVILTQPALTDLENIVAFLAVSSPAFALSVGKDLVDAIFSLDFMPHRGVPLENKPNIRKLIRRHYLIFYSVDESKEAVNVLRVWDARRQPKKFELPEHRVGATRLPMLRIRFREYTAGCALPFNADGSPTRRRAFQMPAPCHGRAADRGTPGRWHRRPR
jgi:plasmid stabilization system protein ParE